MSSSKLLLVALLITSLAGAAVGQPMVAGSPVQATLTVPDRTLLPGVPFEMWIDAQNPSDATVGVGLCADMLVRPPSGPAFTITLGGETRMPYPTLLRTSASSSSAAVHYLTLTPHARQTLTLPLEPELAGPIYFADDRLSPPGSYGIALRLDYCWAALTPQKSLLPPEFLGPVTTNEVTVRRVDPTGIDATIWQRMQDATKGHWSAALWTSTAQTSALTRDILTKYQDSNYYPYALLATSFGAVDQKAYSDVVSAMQRFPKSPVIEMLELRAWGISISTKNDRAYGEHLAKLKASKRPTTRIRAFGLEGLPPEPCPPEYDGCTE